MSSRGYVSSTSFNSSRLLSETRQKKRKKVRSSLLVSKSLKVSAVVKHSLLATTQFLLKSGTLTSQLSANSSTSGDSFDKNNCHSQAHAPSLRFYLDEPPKTLRKRLAHLKRECGTWMEESKPLVPSELIKVLFF